MKKICIRISSMILTSLMLFSIFTTIPVYAYNVSDFALGIEPSMPDYHNYTFEQFYELSDEQLNTIFQECNSNYDNIEFKCFYPSLEQRDAMVKKYGDCLIEPNSSLFDMFCTEFKLPQKYIKSIQPYSSPYDTYVIDSVTFYQAFDIHTIFEYKSPAVLLWNEERKVVNIISTLLVLNPDIYVDLSLTSPAWGGINPMRYYPGDVNWDGKVDIIDAVILSKMAVGNVHVDNMFLALVDCNGNGELDSQDAVVLMKFLTHIINTLPST